ncbi:FbpB family small basic protein [Oceanobacillus manasiensis]|uniref:FbpB family small basic protein n=1 Tax=Oceanobacillus manasiensis TaxID=586413 RepID=UPI000A028809|nr:FbpB family small basic protein [Oceanobacillus manasiensis]
MRPKTLNFEQLFQQNKQELLDDEREISQIELRLEKRQSDKVLQKKKLEQNNPLSTN